MTTLIVGCGYLGLEIAKNLRAIEPNSEVFGTTRHVDRFAKIAESGATPILADVFDEESLRVLPETDRIVHCISLGRQSAGPASEAMDRFLNELKRRNWHGRLIHVSTTGVYGQVDGSWVDEATPCEPSTESGRVAMQVEDAARSAAAESGFLATSIRMSGLYGPNRVIGRSGLERGEAIGGDPDRWLNLIHIEDAAQVVFEVLNGPNPGPIYVASDDRPILRRVYYETVAKTLGVSVSTWKPIDEFAHEPNKRVSNEKIRREFGIKLRYPTIFEGLPASIERFSA